MIRNIFKSIEVLIDMYYHRKKLRFRYKRIKRYQRKGVAVDINKIDKIRDRDLKLLNDCLQEHVKTILKNACVKADIFSNGTIGVTVWYNGKPFNRRIHNYYDFSSNLNNCMGRIDAIVQEIKNQGLIKDNTINDNNYRNLKSVIEEELNSILEGIEVNVSKIYSKPIRVEISYKDCTEWFELSDYMLKEGLFDGVLVRAKRVAYKLSTMQQEYEISERIRLNILDGEVKRLIRGEYPNIEVELQKDFTGKGYYLLLKCYGMSSAKYVMRNSSKQKYLELASDFNNKVNEEIQRKQQEKDKKKALFKKNNPLNLKVGEIYRVKYKFSSNWESVYIERITTDGFPWKRTERTEMGSGILDAENYDVKTDDGKWIHNRKAWEEFKNKKIKPYRNNCDTFRLESKPIHLWDFRTYREDVIKLDINY